MICATREYVQELSELVINVIVAYDLVKHLHIVDLPILTQYRLAPVGFFSQPLHFSFLCRIALPASKRTLAQLLFIFTLEDN